MDHLSFWVVRNDRSVHLMLIASANTQSCDVLLLSQACATFRSILNMQSGCVQKLIMHSLNACMSASWRDQVVLPLPLQRSFCAGCCDVQDWSGLHKELAVDMQRLWQRNLGRDDRLVADTSRCFLSLPDSVAKCTMYCQYTHCKLSQCQFIDVTCLCQHPVQLMLDQGKDKLGTNLLHLPGKQY